MRSMWVFFCSLFFSIGVSRSFGSVVLIGNNVTLSFENTESNFAPLVKGSGKCGILYVAEPLDACSPLTSKVSSKLNDPRSPFVLIIRGGCSFEDKVRTAQTAGFRAAIVYDNENGALIAMAGHSIGINIPAVFVSKISGETLRDYASMADLNLWILPSFQNTAWSIMGISFISLLAMMCAVVVSCFFVRRHRNRGRRRERHRAPRVQEFLGMSSRLVKAMPSVIFTAELENNCASKTCTICLEDYIVGEKLRILPCCHMFHANCVDTWLTSWRTFCPICKRDARSHEGNPPSAEYTPLLSTLVSSSSPLSSYRSSSATEFGPSFSLPSSVSHPQPASETHCNQMHHQNTAQTVPDPSSQRSFIAFVGHYPLSPLNSRCPSPYPPGNGSYI